MVPGADRNHVAGYNGEPSNGQGTPDSAFAIDIRVGRPQVRSMQPIRTAARWLRLGLAIAFVVATGMQVPAMAVACATGSVQHRPVSASSTDHDHHLHDNHSHSGHQHQPGPIADIVDAAHDPVHCYAMGCCMALDPSAAHAPAVVDILLGVLGLAPARVMLPALPEPADPPPRVQV
jgi:hypothetical protein